MIFHVDVNSAFLSWEAVYRLKVLGWKEDIREIPSAVAGDISKRHGIILAKSNAAKAYGIHTGESIPEAKKKCPDLVLVSPHYDLYEKSSYRFMELLREYSPCVEQYSVDEAFCDMSNLEYIYGDPVHIAHEIKERIKEELGFTVNIGISSNKLLAKMASDFQKPDRVHTLFSYEVQQKMWPLPVGELFFVGRATERRLKKLGITTIGELANVDVSILKSHLKKHGEVIHSFANGIDVSVVSQETPDNKGYGNSTTIAFDVDNDRTAKIVLLALSETVSARLREHHVLATVVSVTIVDCEFRRISHQMTLLSATNGTNEIHQTACRLFDELWDGMPIRHLGVHTSKVLEDVGSRQLNLFDRNRYEKLQKMDVAVDKIRERFGTDSIIRASFLNSSIYHMSGGIPPEKRKVNYNQER